jgi:hypothetical protein
MHDRDWTYSKVTYEEFCDKFSVLDISIKTSEYIVKNNVRDFIKENSKDYRLDKIDEFYKNFYEMVVTNREETLDIWFDKYLDSGDIKKYFSMGTDNLLKGKVINGIAKSKYGRLLKNINFDKMYRTKKLYHDDKEFVIGMMEVLFRDFKIRNSLVGPAFFKGILNKDINGFWSAFMMTCSTPSVFNPYTFKFILENFFNGKKLFCPVLGWNSYQLAFHNTTWEEFVGTDVIPEVVDNGKVLYDYYLKTIDNKFFDFQKQNVKNYLCPSEKFDINGYEEYFDGVLFSPPYYNLEIYDSENQSIDTFPKYEDWLDGYWETTVSKCYDVLKKGKRFGFLIRDYLDRELNEVCISEDMKKVVEKYFVLIDVYQVKWGARKLARTPEKMRNGNYENFYLFEKK